jgi:hypothetical protein
MHWLGELFLCLLQHKTVITLLTQKFTPNLVLTPAVGTLFNTSSNEGEVESAQHPLVFPHNHTSGLPWMLSENHTLCKIQVLASGIQSILEIVITLAQYFVSWFKAHFLCEMNF